MQKELFLFAKPFSQNADIKIIKGDSSLNLNPLNISDELRYQAKCVYKALKIPGKCPHPDVDAVVGVFD